jgi:hypothetical protein
MLTAIIAFFIGDAVGMLTLAFWIALRQQNEERTRLHYINQGETK